MLMTCAAAHQTLAEDLTSGLLEKGSPNATRMKVMVKQRQLVLQGGYWKNDVMEWLIAKGF
jgi:large subunit ribosomal protein L49